MGRRAAGAIVTFALAVTLPSLLAGCGVLPSASTAAWVWPTPFPRPADAVTVPIDVEPVAVGIQPDTIYNSRPLALLAPLTPEYRADDAEQPVHYRLVDTGEEVQLAWQTGFQAWLRRGLQIVAPDGKVIAADGQVATDLGGGQLGNDDRFTVCIGEYAPKRAIEQS